MPSVNRSIRICYFDLRMSSLQTFLIFTEIYLWFLKVEASKYIIGRISNFDQNKFFVCLLVFVFFGCLQEFSHCGIQLALSGNHTYIYDKTYRLHAHQIVKCLKEIITRGIFIIY